jgi:hypothetical protein
LDIHDSSIFYAVPSPESSSGSLHTWVLFICLKSKLNICHDSRIVFLQLIVEQTDIGQRGLVIGAFNDHRICTATHFQIRASKHLFSNIYSELFTKSPLLILDATNHRHDVSVAGRGEVT